jgi:hypothetical protein
MNGESLMNLKMLGFVALVVIAIPELVIAGNFFSPWGAMNELVTPWEDDLKRQKYRQAQPQSPQYPTRPIRTLRQRQIFSQPLNHASVDIQARLPEVPVFIKRANGTKPYKIQIGVLTPEYRAMSVVGYPANTTPSDTNRQFELNCEIESIRRWDRDQTRGWSVLVAATFNDKGTAGLLDKANTVLMAHGVCYPMLEKPGQLSPKGVYEFHAAFVSQFADNDETGVMMEIGTGMRFNTAGNGYFQRTSVEMAFTALGHREDVSIRYR